MQLSPTRYQSSTVAPNTPRVLQQRSGGASLWNSTKLTVASYCLLVHPVANSLALGHPASPQAIAGFLPSVLLNAFLGNVGRSIANSMETYNFENLPAKRLLDTLKNRELTGVFTDLSPHENLGNRSTWGFLCAVWNEQCKYALFGTPLTKTKALTTQIKEPLLKRFTNTLVRFPPSRWLLNTIMFLLPGNSKVGMQAHSHVATALGHIPFVGKFLKEKTMVLAKMKGLYFKTAHNAQELTYLKTGKQIASIGANGETVWQPVYTPVANTLISTNEKASALRYGITQLLKLSPDTGVGVWIQRWNHGNAPLTNTLWDTAQTGNIWRGFGAAATHYTNWLADMASGKLLTWGGNTLLHNTLATQVSPAILQNIQHGWQVAGSPILQASVPNLLQKPLWGGGYRGSGVGYRPLNPPTPLSTSPTS